MKNKPRVFYLSSIDPQPTTSGYLIMYRHLIERDDLTVDFYNDSDFYHDTEGLLFYRILTWVRQKVDRTRFHEKFKYLDLLLQSLWVPHGLTRRFQTFKPEVILTVAHGRLHWMAYLISKKFDIPLVTIFHDWWPIFAPVSDSLREKLAEEMLTVHAHSTISLAVCEGMRKILGGDAEKMERTRLLYPLSASNDELKSWNGFSESSEFRLLYAGNSSGHYGEKLRRLIESIRAQNNARLSIYTGNCDWDLADATSAREERFLNSFLNNKDLLKEYENSDFLLVMMSEEQPKNVRTTSFPCKTVDYLRSGKPVVVWGPEDSSLIQFFKGHRCGLIVTDPDPKVLLESCRKWRENPDEVRLVTQRAVEVSRTILDPTSIHHELVNALTECIKTHKR